MIRFNFLENLVGVDFIFICKNSYEINKCENCTDTETESHNNFKTTLFGFTKHKVMNTESAKEKRQKANAATKIRRYPERQRRLE